MTHVRRLARLAASRFSRRASQREQLRRKLRAEQLESRNMMAADWLVSDFWNGTRPEDVNADGQVAPLDALMVINQLNGYGSQAVMGPNAARPMGASEGETSAAGDKPVYYDVNNDGEISPIDALLVINSLNGEGEGEVVQYQVQIMQPGTNIPMSTVAKGQEFDLRVVARDGRVGGRGVFAGYLDILLNDSSLARPRASEVQHVVIDSTATGFDTTAGNLTLTFNGQTTAPIFFSNETSDPNAVAATIQQRLEAMAGIGVGNVRVINDPIFATDEVEGEPFRWQVRFVNNLYDTDVSAITGTFTPDVGTAAATLRVDQTAEGNINDPAAFREAFRSQLIPGVNSTVYYVNALNAGNLSDRIDDVGAFATGGSPFPGTAPVELVRARMIALDGGVLTFDPDVTDVLSSAHDTLLYDRNTRVEPAEILLSNPVSITITEDIMADDELVTMPEDTLASNPITNIPVLAGDTTTLPGTLQVRSVNTAGITGTVTFTPTGVKYVPAANFVGQEIFTYTVGIGASGGPTDTATVTVDVTAVNDAPANNVPGPQNVNEDTALVFSAANSNAITIGDIDAGTANMQVVLTATNGTLTMGSTANLTVVGNGNISITITGPRGDINAGLNGLTFNPTGNFVGNASISVHTDDLGNTGGGALTDTDNIGIVVGPVNDAPVNSVPAAQAVDEMVPLVFSTANGNGISVSDIDAGSGQVQVTVSVPAGAGLLSIGGNPGAISLVLTGTVASVNTQLNGLTFTPADGFTGFTTLTVVTNDQGNTGSGGPLSDTDLVQIEVEAVLRPRARPDTINLVEGAGPFTLPDVMANDLGNLIPGDPEGDEFPTTLEAVGTASVGTVTINDNGTATNTDDFLVYTPPSADFFGTVTFSYSIWDTSSTPPGTIPDHATATVTLVIGNENDVPVAADDSYSTAEDTALTVPAPGVLGNDSDVDNNFGGPTDPQTAVIVTNPAHGTVTLNANGSFTYTPTANYNGPDSFTYKVRDGQNAESNVATVSIDVTAVNDAPVAANDSFNATEDTTLNVPAPGVLGNDSDVDSASFTAEIVAQAAHGTVTLNADGSFSYVPVGNYSGPDSFTYRVRDDLNALSNIATVNLTVAPINDPPVAADDSYIATEDTTLNVPARGVLVNDTDIDSATLTAVLVSPPALGNLTLNSNGSFSYAPPANFTGLVSFTYRASDGPGLSNIATVTIDVREVDDPPTAQADSYSTNEDQPLVVPAIGVLGNDNDPETGTAALTAHLVSAMPASQGTVALATDGSFTFTPAANFSGTTSFTYRAFDNLTFSAPVTVTITVTEVNDPPTATNDSVVAIKDIPNQPISVLGNDSILPDVGETLSVVAVNGGTGPVATTAGGTVQLVGGQIRYTPAAGFTGSDSFQYTISDNRAVNPLTATATVNINVIAFVPKVISGTVYIDADGDGQIDAGESRVQNAEVRLNGTDFLGAAVNLVAFTDVNGRYEFRGAGPQLLGLAPGSYTVTGVQPRYLGDGQDTETSPLAARIANDTFQVAWNEFDFSGHITGLNFGETGINASALADSSGLLQELLASSGSNGFVLTTNMSGSTVWSWSMPGWSNMQSCQIVLDANLANATLKVTDKAGNLHQIRIHQSPAQNTESNYPSGSMARFRILGRSATNEYIIRIDGTAADFGLNLLAAAAGEGEGEGDNREFAEAADELFAAAAWA